MDPNSPTSSGLAAEIAKEPKESKAIIDTLDLSKYGTNRFWWFCRTGKANIIFLILVACVISLIYLLEDLIRTNKCSADKTKASLYVIGILASSVAIYQLIWPHTKLWAVTSKSSKMTGWAALAHRQKIDKKIADIKVKAKLTEIEAANKPQEPPKPTSSDSDPNYYKPQQFQPQPQIRLAPPQRPQYKQQPPQQNLPQVNNRNKILAISQQYRNEHTRMDPVLNELTQSEQYKRRQNSAVIAPMSISVAPQQPVKVDMEAAATFFNAVQQKRLETRPLLETQPTAHSL